MKNIENDLGKKMRKMDRGRRSERTNRERLWENEREKNVGKMNWNIGKNDPGKNIGKRIGENIIKHELRKNIGKNERGKNRTKISWGRTWET